MTASVPPEIPEIPEIPETPETPGTGTTETPPPLEARELDNRPRSLGPGRVLIAVYAVMALAATARSVVQLATRAAEAPLAYGLSAFAAVVYVVATLALAHNGPRARVVAWVAVSIELVGVLAVGALSLGAPQDFPDETVWSVFGIGYGFVPLVLPVLGLVYLSRTRPGRAAA